MTRAEQHGLCRALSYIIQTLSAEASFGAKLSAPLKVQPPTKWTVSGTAGDFLINVRFAPQVLLILKLNRGLLGNLCDGCHHFRQSQFPVPRTYHNLVELGAILQESNCDGVIETPSIIHVLFESLVPTLGRGPSSVIVLYVSLSLRKHSLSTNKYFQARGFQLSHLSSFI